MKSVFFSNFYFLLNYLIEVASEQTLVEPNWEGILECVDMIRGADVP